MDHFIIRRKIALGVGFLLISLALASLVLLDLNHAPTPYEKVVSADGLWSSHQVRHYQLVVDYLYGLIPGKSTCEQTLEVRDEQILGVSENTCPESGLSSQTLAKSFQPVTISVLFKQLENTVLRPAYFNIAGQQCPIMPDVTYDHQLAYPVVFQNRACGGEPLGSDYPRRHFTLTPLS